MLQLTTRVLTRTFTDKLLDASLKLAEVEKRKSRTRKTKHRVSSRASGYSTKRLNEQLQAENAWSNKEKRREYHFNGVKAILMFVGIKEPMNLVILYILNQHPNSFLLA